MTTSLLDINSELKSITREARELKSRIAELTEVETKSREAIARVASSFDDQFRGLADPDSFTKFFERPYAIGRDPENEAARLVYVPRFIQNFQPGWLVEQTETFSIYRINQYTSWLSDAPLSLYEEAGINLEPPLRIEASFWSDTISFDPKDEDGVRDLLRGHIAKYGEGHATIKRGHEFDVLVEIIKSGMMPFKQWPVSQHHLRDSVAENLDLRPDQMAVFDEFMQCGSIGCFQPTGWGKTYLGIYILSRLIGNKIVVVDSRTLVDQWEARLEEHLPNHYHEVHVITYQKKNLGDYDGVIAIFDECQRLPANTFSRAALIKLSYRIGMSAAPFREDGREEYIFALTGKPIGCDWKTYMESVGRDYHPIYVHIVSNKNDGSSKLRKMVELQAKAVAGRGSGKCIVFCDGIDLGGVAAQQLGCPHIHGETKDRLDIIDDHQTVVMSRVGDQGVSVEDLQTIIEIDFHGKSRNQALQRSGRLMHSKRREGLAHHIVMMEREYEDSKRRLFGLESKGFSIEVVTK